MAYRYQQSLSRCILPSQDIWVQQQPATCGKTPTIVTWREPWYCYAININSRRIRSQVRPRNGADISELQAHCGMPGPWTWLLCSVSVSPANKLSLQELSKLLEIELLTLSFLKNFGSYTQFPVGQMPVFLPADALAQRCSFIKNTKLTNFYSLEWFIKINICYSL